MVHNVYPFYAEQHAYLDCSWYTLLSQKAWNKHFCTLSYGTALVAIRFLCLLFLELLHLYMGMPAGVASEAKVSTGDVGSAAAWCAGRQDGVSLCGFIHAFRGLGYVPYLLTSIPLSAFTEC